MITEDYVSFEVAKLLKEKGFDEKCNIAYFNGTLVDYTMFGFCLGGDLLYCPTLQMAMKWLREVHKWHIEISRGEYGYFVHIVSAKNLSTENYAVQLEGGYNLSYEEACESAIKYCLENLI